MAKSFPMSSAIAFAVPSLRRLRLSAYDPNALLSRPVNVGCSVVALCRLVDTIRTFGRLKA